MTTLPKIWIALSLSFCPNLIATNVEAPTPTNEPKAAARFISGKVIAKPAIARGPTPCPIKILSTMLYSDDAVMAIIAGIAYCISNFPIFSVPKTKGVLSFTLVIPVATFNN